MSGRVAWVVCTVLVSGCLVPLSERDGGVDASTQTTPDAGGEVDADAGQTDAGLDAGGADASIDSLVLSFNADDQRVHLTWDAGGLRSTGWMVLRDNQPLATLGAAAREFDDVTAPPGALVGFDASATRAVPDGIELEWTIPSAQPGPSMAYRVRATDDASLALESNEVRAMRSAPALLGFTVERGDGGWSFSPVETVFLDTSAPSPSVTMTGLQAQAQPNDQTSSIVLRATATASRVAMSLSYTVRARASAGVEPEVTVSGDRGGNRVDYQWQRSLDDSPDAFFDLPYVHGTLWFDPEAALSDNVSETAATPKFSEQGEQSDPTCLA